MTIHHLPYNSIKLQELGQTLRAICWVMHMHTAFYGPSAGCCLVQFHQDLWATSLWSLTKVWGGWRIMISL